MADEAQTLFERARDLARAGNTRESNDAVDELVRRFEHDVDVACRTLVCRALLGRTKDRLAAGGVDRRVAIVEYRHVLQIAERPPLIEPMVAEALFHLALTSAKLAVERGDADHRERATSRFAEIARRFGGATDPVVAHWVARAAECEALLRDA
ncbi:MAG TPA: hypothetical protein VIF62_19640 [Labilithrix sp.]